MKILQPHLNQKFLSIKLLFILIISCMSNVFMDVHCLDDNKSNDRLALLAFKDGITRDPLGVLSTWNNNNNDSLDFCQWKGVACNRGRVTYLNIGSQKLLGSISPHIGNLSFLEDLILYNNSFTGKIPQQIGHLSRLKRLGLSYNYLEGDIPENMSRCANLTILDLSNNNLSGQIPTLLGNLSSLTYLGLAYNNLDGRIPDTLGHLTSLKTLIFSSNRFSGIVPSSLYNISSLEGFSLTDNQLHGSIPLNIGLTLPNLIEFSVAENSFSGTIPSSFSNLSRLTMLQVNRNNLVGPVPYNLGNSKSLELLLLGANKLGSGQSNDLSFIDSLTNCTNLRVLIAGNNNFGGLLPSSIENLTRNLVTLVLQNNKIYGSVPSGIQNLVGLTNLYLDGNRFTGSIPSSIGNLQNLGRLNLGKNRFWGSIPSSFGNLTKMILLNLSDNGLTGLIPSSLGYCQSLQSLILGNNRLSGNIPKQVFELPSLSVVLSLANNSFTGSLPGEVGNMKNLGWLDISGNKLSGEIPSSIGECLSLTYINMQGNLFQGNISTSITFLKGLETLILSHNKFSGIIPKDLENLQFLQRLDLSFNNLEGEVPEKGVFRNLSALSISGNSRLCGGVPALKLQNCSMHLNSHTQRKSMTIKVIIIIVVVVVLFLTLIVVFLPLYWKMKSSSKLPSMALDVGKRFEGVSYNELLKATNGFNNSTNLIGKGSFGSVYKGVLKQDESKPVAVKVLHLHERGATRSFIAECDALRKVRHRNLLKIINCCSSIDFHGNPFTALICEFMANGSLEDWLHPPMCDANDNDQLRNLNLERRLSIAVDVASALNYLHHDCPSPIVHCDLKPSNVLLDDDLTAHVGDFGLAEFLSNSSSSSRQLNEQDASSIVLKGSIGYVPPEYGMGGEVSTQGDVYSYGILLLEIFTGKRPTDDIFKDGLNIHKFCKMYAFPERIEEIIDSRLLLNVEGEHHSGSTRDTVRQIMSCIIQIGVKCSSELPSDRNCMNEVVVDLQALQDPLQGLAT